MKSASPAMIALLNGGGPFCMADLYTLTTRFGEVIRFTDADLPITVAGNTFNSGALIVTRTKTKTIIGLATDTMTINLSSAPGVLMGGSSPYAGQSVMSAIRSGYLDGGRFLVERFIGPNFADTSAGSIVMFSGRVSDIPTISRNVASINVHSDLELLDMKLPRNLYQPGCTHTLYDAGCKASRSALQKSGTVGSGASYNTIPFAGISQADGYFAMGAVTFTSGSNAGLTIGIKDYVSNVATLSYGVPNAPIAGDAFVAVPGCDKLQSTCTNKFNNLANFKGFPYVPTPETAL
jgi:uncharacterized phage protein (TIGR02218 family)